MSTAFSLVVAAVMAALSAEPAVCGAIYRARSSAIPEQDDQAVSVQFEQALPQLGGVIAGAPIDWTTKITVDCYARSTKETGDLAVDPLFQAVYARLAQDTTLGGLVADLNIAGIEAENTSDAKKAGWVRLTYIAEHRTSNLTLS